MSTSTQGLGGAEGLTKAEILTVLSRYRGAKARVARKANVRPQTVSCWLRRDLTSAPIEAAARAVVGELLEQERHGSAS